MIKHNSNKKRRSIQSWILNRPMSRRPGIWKTWQETKDNLIKECILALFVIPIFLILSTFISSLPDMLQLSGFVLIRSNTATLPAAPEVVSTVAPADAPIEVSVTIQTVSVGSQQDPVGTLSPSQTPTPAVEQFGECLYRIHSGDVLEKIARYFDVSIEAIVAANSISDPNLIIAGRELLIPGSKVPCPEGGIPGNR